MQPHANVRTAIVPYQQWDQGQQVMPQQQAYPQHFLMQPQQQKQDTAGSKAVLVVLLLIPLIFFVAWGVFLEIRVTAIQQSLMDAEDVKALKAELAEVRQQLETSSASFNELAELLQGGAEEAEKDED